MQHINPPSLSKPTGYTHVVVATGGRTVYISGQIALNASGELVGKGDLKAQSTQVFENLKAALAAAGATFDDVTKITVFMTDVSELPAFRSVRDQYIKGAPPASTLVQVVRLARPDLLIEVEAIAVID
jgi:reactive intermediate/imine deaminase